MSFTDEYGQERPRFTVTPERSVPPLGRQFLNAVAGGESPDYNTIYGGQKFSDYSDHPRVAVPITTGPNAGQTSSAAGKYQFLGSTWDQVANEAGLKNFSPENQDLGAWYLAQKTYKSKTGRDLLGDLESNQRDPNAINNIARTMSGVWTSLPGGIERNNATASFAQRFAGEGGTPTTGPVPQGGGYNFSPVSSAQAAEAPTAKRSIFDTLDQPAAPKTSIFDSLPKAPAQTVAVDTSQFNPSANIGALQTQLRRVADEKLAGPGGGGITGEVGTFASQLANTMGLNVPRNILAAHIAQQYDIPSDQAYSMLKDIDAAGDRLNPAASWRGFVGGLVGGAVGGPVIGTGKVAAMGTAALYSALSEFFDSKDPVKAGIAGTLGGALGLVVPAVAGKVINFLTSFAKSGKNPASFLKDDGTLTDEALAAVREAGIDPADLTKVLHGAYAQKFAEKGATPAAAREAAAGEFGIPLTQGKATQDLGQIQREEMTAKGAYGRPAMQIAGEGRTAEYQGIQGGGQQVNQQVARGQVAENPAEAATIANAEIGDKARVAQQALAAKQQAAAEAEASIRQQAVDRETALRQLAADQEAGLRGNAAQQQEAVAAQQRALDEQIAQGRLPQTRQETGAAIGQTVRDAAAESAANYKRTWEGALDLPGEFSDLAFRGIGERIRQAVASPVTNRVPLEITPELTPMANSALIALDKKIGELGFQNRALPKDAEPRTAGYVQFPGEPMRMGGAVQEPGTIAGITLRGMDTARKIFGQYYSKALSSGDKTDIRAVGMLKDAFMDDIRTSLSTGLFKGDARAWPQLEEAIGAFRQHQEFFKPQYNDRGVGAAMKQIVEQKATPEEIGNMFLGLNKTGEPGLSARLADHVEKVFGKDSDIWSQIQQGLWTKVSQVRNRAGEIDPLATASAIKEFTKTTTAQRIFGSDSGVLDAMNQHANDLRSLYGTVKGLEGSVKNVRGQVDQAIKGLKPATESAIEGSPAVQEARAAQTDFQKLFSGKVDSQDIGGGHATIFRRIVDGTATPQEISTIVGDAISGNPGNGQRMIKAIKGIVGDDNPAISALGQVIWQKTISGNPGSQRLANNIRELTDGQGAGIAKEVFRPEDIALMRRYATAVDMTRVPDAARITSPTAPAAMAAARETAGNAVASALEHTANSKTFVGGTVIRNMLKARRQAKADTAEANKATQSFFGGAPTQPPPPRQLPDLSGLATSTGLATRPFQ